MGRLNGKIAFITGAGRRQGRTQRSITPEPAPSGWQEGADIIALDILEDVEELAYPMATTADRDQTVATIKELGRRILVVARSSSPPAWEWAAIWSPACSLDSVRRTPTPTPP